MRFYYYAIPGSGESWEIHSSLEGVHTTHDSKDLALLAARSKCRRHWEDHGAPCGVRIRIDVGHWEDVELFGPEGKVPQFRSTQA